MRHAQLIMQTVCLSISRTLCSSSFRLWKKRGFFNVPGAKAALQLLPHRAMTSPSSKIEVTAKVQLHIHLDGALRFESIIPMAKGHLDSIRRLAREFAEDMAADNVIYTEARYCPHLMIEAGGTLTPDQVIEAIADEFELAEKKYNIKLRQILCCMRSLPQFSLEIAELCKKYKHRGVVAIDIAGDENMVETTEPTQPEHFTAFEVAKGASIHRTVHAGENGSPAVVHEALDKMHAERIGHGYHSVLDDGLYQKLLEQRTHFECCPWSSILTGACSPKWELHSLKRFHQDDASFSLNTDDPTLTATKLSDEYVIVERELGIPALRLIKSVFDAARAAFLPEDEKSALIERLRNEYSHIPETKDY